MGYSGARGTLIYEKNLQAKFSCQTPFKHVFHLSLTTGIVPNQLKIAKVIPIFKNGDPTALDNYRPISLLSNFSKILEKIVGNR